MERRFIDIKSASEFLMVSTSFVYKKIKTIPHYRVGRKILFCPEELRQFVLNRRNLNKPATPVILNEIEQLRVPSLAA